MKSEKRLKKRNGFSALEAVVASVSVGILVMGTATIITDGAKVTNYMDFQSVLNQMHNYDVQKVRHMQNLRTKLVVPGIIDPNEPCYRGMQRANGGSCAGLTTGDVTVPGLFDDEVQIRDLASTKIRSNLTYRIECTAQRCSRVVFTVNTAPDQEATSQGITASPRSTTFSLPLTYLVNKQNLDFGCASVSGTSSPPLMSIDYSTLRSSCASPYQAPGGATECTGSMPLQAMGSSGLGCQASQAVVCANGATPIGVRTFAMLSGGCNTL